MENKNLQIGSYRLLYERTYSIEDEINCHMNDAAFLQQIESLFKELPTFDELLKMACESLSYKYIPEREQDVCDFIKKAIAVSENYKISMEMRKYNYKIAVILSFPAIPDMVCLKELICDADSIGFLPTTNEDEIVMCLDYYTHRVFRNGRQMHPFC